MYVRLSDMMRLLLASAVALLALAPMGAALAQSDDAPKKKTERKPAAKKAAATSPTAGATQVATFSDWSVYTANSGRSKICFAQSEPKARSPASLKDQKAYLFVSFRPGDGVRNELAAVLNFKTKEDGPASLVMGATNYDLVTKGENAWVKNPSDEALAIGTMSKGGNMTLQATSARGNKTADRYSLAGFQQALERAKRDCP